MTPHLLIIATLSFLAGLLYRSGEPVWAFACHLCCIPFLCAVLAYRSPLRSRKRHSIL